MTKQAKLFETEQPRHGPEHYRVPARVDSPPQQEAAAKVRPWAGKQCHIILTALERHGPLIREEITEKTGICNQAACARLRDMEQKGWVRKAKTPAGNFLYRHARSGISVHIYEITDEGRCATEAQRTQR